MGSSRLPGKVLLRYRRAADAGARRRAHAPGKDWSTQVVVATTTEPADDPVADYCDAHGYPVYRGSLHDVLDRYYQAARWSGRETVVRITADCPLIDPAVIDRTVKAFLGADLPPLAVP